MGTPNAILLIARVWEAWIWLCSAKAIAEKPKRIMATRQTTPPIALISRAPPLKIMLRLTIPRQVASPPE